MLFIKNFIRLPWFMWKACIGFSHICTTEITDKTVWGDVYYQISLTASAVILFTGAGFGIFYLLYPTTPLSIVFQILFETIPVWGWIIIGWKIISLLHHAVQNSRLRFDHVGELILIPKVLHLLELVPLGILHIWSYKKTGLAYKAVQAKIRDTKEFFRIHWYWSIDTPLWKNRLPERVKKYLFGN
ncbi:MAG TPA: hypothetical protein VLB02_01200 [Candidatus Paceibacterota bacterium]|nr:hypothetical protein [Candidatus Paceibacterota bacterium]